MKKLIIALILSTILILSLSSAALAGGGCPPSGPDYAQFAADGLPDWTWVQVQYCHQTHYILTPLPSFLTTYHSWCTPFFPSSVDGYSLIDVTSSDYETGGWHSKTVRLYTAHYGVPLPTYTLTYAANNGTIVGENPQEVTEGHSGTPVSVVPYEGYQFSHWSDGSTDNPRTDMNIQEDLMVVATCNYGTPLSMIMFGHDCSTLEVKLTANGKASVGHANWNIHQFCVVGKDYTLEVNGYGIFIPAGEVFSTSKNWRCWIDLKVLEDESIVWNTAYPKAYNIHYELPIKIYRVSDNSTVIEFQDIVNGIPVPLP